MSKKKITIKPYGNNAKKHPDQHVRKVADSIKRFGWQQPIIVDKDGDIIAGHGRYLAYEKHGDEFEADEPWVKRENGETILGKQNQRELTPDEVKAYRLADNKLNESDWDMELVTEELKDLDDELLELTGFDKDLVIEPDEADDEVPDVPEEPKSKLGDLYELGEHRVLCGDSTKQEDVERLMDGEKADMVFTDPPYGMNYSGRGEDTGNKIKGDNQDPTKFYSLGQDISERYIWGRVENYKHLPEEPRDTIVWYKNNFGMGKGYRGQYEVCFYFGNFSGSDSDVWEVNKDTKYKHPTQKPTALCARAIKNSKPNIIIDYFLGSGSTLIAAEKTGRICYGMELDPKYIDVIVQRYVDYVDNPVVKLNGKDITWEKSK